MLHEFQEEIVDECIKKGSGGLSLPMGSGKTLIALTVGLKQLRESEHMLIVVSKSLVHSWKDELAKWFPDVKYQTLLLSDSIKPDVKIVLVTPTTLVKYYKIYNIEGKYIVKERMDNMNALRNFNGVGVNAVFGSEINHYIVMNRPLNIINSNSYYGMTFGVLIVDEAHSYMNISTKTCRSICSINARNRWLLSGTLFSEPKLENILGFYKMINDFNIPDNLPYLKRYISYTNNYKGVHTKLVHRKDNEMFINRPKLKKHVVNIYLSEYEEYLYTMLKNIIVDTYKDIDKAKLFGEKEEVKKLNAMLLGMILNLRLFIVSPMLVIAKLYMSSLDTEKANDIYKVYSKHLNKHSLLEYMNDEENIKSTRIRSILDTIKEHTKERIIVFSAFKKTLDYFKPLISDRKVYSLESKHSNTRRSEILEEYRNDTNGILLLTYKLGSEGLNLQCASNILLMDVWWNDSTTQQSIARAYRYGQTKNVNVYMYVSNTKIEEAIYNKHSDKNSIVSELMVGKINSKVRTMKMKEIIQILNQPLRVAY